MGSMGEELYGTVPNTMYPEISLTVNSGNISLVKVVFPVEGLGKLPRGRGRGSLRKRCGPLPLGQPELLGEDGGYRVDMYPREVVRYPVGS